MAKLHLDTHKSIPYFHLQAREGDDFDSSSFKRKKSLLLFFLSSIKKEFLFKIEESLPGISSQNTEVALISPLSLKDVEEMHLKNRLTFRILCDENREVTSKFIDFNKGEEFAAVFITDRSGDLFFQYLAKSPDEFPPFEDIVKSLSFLESQHI